jgi:hypothetical protein
MDSRDITVLFPFRGSHPTRQANLEAAAAHTRLILPDAQYLFPDDNDRLRYNRGRSIMNGMKDCVNPVLVFMDADLLVTSESLLKAVEMCRKGEGSFVMPFSSIAFLNEAASSSVREGADPFQQWTDGDVDMWWVQRSVGTCNVVLRETFDAAGKFDPRHRGYGFEDASWHLACETLVGPPAWVEARATHLWHPSSRVPTDPVYKASWALCRRYEKAYGNREAILGLIAERTARDYE